MIKIARSLDIRVVAETVETEQEIAALITLGIDAMMGYGLQAPGKWEV